MILLGGVFVGGTLNFDRELIGELLRQINAGVDLEMRRDYPSRFKLVLIVYERDLSRVVRVKRRDVSRIIFNEIFR